MIRGMLRETYFHGEDDEIAVLSALCPACDYEHGFRVDLTGHGRWTTQDVWTFNGDYDSPTFEPSMGHNMHGHYPEHHLCHSFVRDGHWEYLADSTHALAGQTVPMVPPDPDMGFKRRHGWHLFPGWENET